MAVMKRCRQYIASVRDVGTADVLTSMMNKGDLPGRSGHGEAMNPGERICAVHYADGNWFIFTEEVVMGPVT